MSGCNKDVPLAVNHYNRCGGSTANQNGSNEMKPVGNPPRRNAWTKGGGLRVDKRRGSISLFRRMLLSRSPLKSAVAQTSVIILSAVQHSFAKASRIKRNLKTERHHGICK